MDAKLLKRVLDTAQRHYVIAQVVVEKNIMCALMADIARVSMLDITVRSEEFDCIAEFAFNIDPLKSFARLLEGDVSFSLDRDRGKLVVDAGHLSRTISLVNQETLSNPRWPDLDLEAKVKIDAARLESGIQAASQVSEQLSLMLDDQAFYIAAEGDIDSIEAKYPLNNLEGVERTMGIIKAKYAIPYIEIINAMHGLVTIEFGNDKPVVISANDDKTEITTVIAPRVG